MIKYKQLVGISKSEDKQLIKTDTNALKYGLREGLDNLVVHTLKYEYKMINMHLS